MSLESDRLQVCLFFLVADIIIFQWNRWKMGLKAFPTAELRGRGPQERRPPAPTAERQAESREASLGTRQLVCAQTRSMSSCEDKPGSPCTDSALCGRRQLRLLRRPDQSFRSPPSPGTQGRGPAGRPTQDRPPGSAMAARGLFSAEGLVRRQHAPLVQVVSAYFKQPGDGRDVAFFCTCCLRV